MKTTVSLLEHYYVLPGACIIYFKYTCMRQIINSFTDELYLLVFPPFESDSSDQWKEALDFSLSNHKENI